MTSAGYPHCRALIVGDGNDPHVAAVLDHLPSTGVVVIDGDSLPRILLELGRDYALLLDQDGGTVVVDESSSTRGWIRRFAPAGWSDGTTIGGHRAAILASRLNALGALLRWDIFDWLTPLDHLVAAENKLVQYRAAESIGVSVPATVVAGGIDRIVATVGDPFVMKPLGPAGFQEVGSDRAVHVRAVSRVDLVNANANLATAPFIAQEFVTTRKHLRIVTVRGKCWVAELDADGRSIDWRRDTDAHRSFRASSSAGELPEQAVRLADTLSVGYSSQDWLLTSRGASYFIDLNPGGQWMFLPTEISASIARSIADWMAPDEQSY